MNTTTTTRGVKYTPEQVERFAAACSEEGQYVVAEMLRAYAATLRQQAGAVDEAMVSDLRQAIEAANKPLLTDRAEQRAAWLAVSFLQDHGSALQAALARPASSEPACGEAASVMVCKIGDYIAVAPREMAAVIYDDKKIAECYTDEDAELVGAALRAYEHPAEPVKVPYVCDGQEQDAFEAWAKGERFNMDCHPLHWLFLNPETCAARQGWKAALEYVSRSLAAAPGADGEVGK